MKQVVLVVIMKSRDNNCDNFRNKQEIIYLKKLKENPFNRIIGIKFDKNNKTNSNDM